MTRLHRAVVAAATALLVLALPRAWAHEEAAVRALAVLTEVTPAVAGLEIRVAQLTAPVIIVTNSSLETLVIEGVDGEPFLRIGSGKVETNLRSPTSYRAADPTGERPLPGSADPAATPQWIVLAREASWSWFDPRAAYSPESPEWSIPGTIGGRALTIRGTFEPIEGHGHFETELDDVPTADGLELRLLDGLVPAIFVRNTSGLVLHVTGRAGEPFLRVGPRGVFGNKSSPDFYAAGSQTVRDVPSHADPEAPPRWERLSRQPVWQWLEYRARLPAQAHQRAALGPEPKTVLSWSTPLRLGPDHLELAGHVEWLPPDVTHDDADHGAYMSWAASAVGAVIALTAFYIVRRRRTRRIV